MKRFIILLILACLTLTGCRTVQYIEKPVITERVTHDTIIKTKAIVSRDTVIQRDSVFVAPDGSKESFRVIYQRSVERATDTLYITVRDSVPVIQTVTKTVTKKGNHSAWIIFSVMLIFCVGIMAVRICRYMK